MARPRAVIIGAGALGLGFLAERLAADYQLHVADTMPKADLLRRLEADQGFMVNICGKDGAVPVRVTTPLTVSLTDTADGQAAFNEALLNADIVLTATGTRFLGGVVAAIRPVLNARTRPVRLLFCENGMRVAESQAAGFKEHVVRADTVMSRMCRFGEARDTGFTPLSSGIATTLIVEEYGYLPLDADQCGTGGLFSKAFTLLAHEQFAVWKDIKFYLHNGMHAFVSYHAFLEGVARFPDVPPRIRSRASAVMFSEVIPAIVATHPVAQRAEIERYARGLLDRFFNASFDDSIERGVRGIEEKLQPAERLLGGCDYIRRAGIEPRGYESTITAARMILARRAVQDSARF
jgi:mannitol-1-phosphate 5-dehydrogenase